MYLSIKKIFDFLRIMSSGEKERPSLRMSAFVRHSFGDGGCVCG